LQTGYFYRDISGFIDRIRESADEPYKPFNFGNNRMQGFNFRVSQAVPIHARSRFQYALSYNYLTPVSTVRSEGMDSKYSLESLKHQLMLRTTYTQNQLRVSFNNRLLKREQKVAYLISDLRIGYDLSKLTFYTDITNLFNQSYIETAAVPMPKRWFALGIKYRLAIL
jgi:vitamin B12 transporter